MADTMGEQRHVIKQQVLEITTSNREQAQPLIAQFSELYHARAIQILDQTFSRLSDATRVDYIERLVVDLGRIDANRLEQDVLSRLESALREALSRHLEEADERGPQIVKDDLLAYFVETGHLPWWADANDRDLLARHLHNLRQNQPEHLVRLLRSVDGGGAVRLANHFEDADLVQLAELLHDSVQHTPAIVRFVQQALPHPPSRVRRSIWRHTLTSAEPRSASAAIFLGGIVRRVAHDFSLTYGTLLRQVADSHAFRTVPAVLQAIWTDLIADEKSQTDSSTVPQTHSRTDQDERADNNHQQNEMAGTEAKPRPKMSDEARPSTDEATQDGVSATQPHAGDIPRSEQTPHSPHEQDHPTGDLRTATNSTESAPRPTSEAESLPQARTERPQPGRIQHRPRIGAGDEIFINNAGLVILWPFLRTFFDRLGFIDEEGNFVDAVTIDKAVLLTQYLVSGQPDVAEYDLPLNKFLCGLNVSDVVDVTLPLEDEQLEACDQLLLAVIAQAPVLRNMSIDGLRGTFLLRAGSLVWRDGIGLLRVEQQAYDVVLSRFPWGWGWVKLPWMPVPLQVEW